MKLKTLKDITNKKDIVEEHMGNLLPEYRYAFIKDLRVEAIKWVKNFNEEHVVLGNNLPETDSRHELYRLNEVEKSILRFWIKMFFNITEKELD